MNMIRKLILSILLALPFLPLLAQERGDSVYRFRFVADKDMFFVPWSDNGRELDRLLSAIAENRRAIDAGDMYILVSSYDSADGQSVKTLAKTRRNRVKSELITRAGVSERNFVTDRSFAEPYNGQYNVVVVTLPASVAKVAEIAGADAAARVEAYNKKVSGEAERERLAAEEKARTEQKRLAAEAEARRQAEAERVAAAERERLAAEEATRLQAGTETDSHSSKSGIHHLSLRANLLRWATLTPDLGIEWRIRNVGIFVNGSYTSWSWNDKDRRYALWEVAPEVRYYIGTDKCGYIGAMYKAGQFNYKFSETGKQGDIMGGGITGGYMLQLNKALALDFNLGLGYIHAGYDKYAVIDGVRVRRGSESKNWWGPVSAGVTLTWTLF